MTFEAIPRRWELAAAAARSRRECFKCGLPGQKRVVPCWLATPRVRQAVSAGNLRLWHWVSCRLSSTATESLTPASPHDDCIERSAKSLIGVGASQLGCRPLSL
jgi:hypothetical protein